MPNVRIDLDKVCRGNVVDVVDPDDARIGVVATVIRDVDPSLIVEVDVPGVEGIPSTSHRSPSPALLDPPRSRHVADLHDAAVVRVGDQDFGSPQLRREEDFPHFPGRQVHGLLGHERGGRSRQEQGEGAGGSRGHVQVDLRRRPAGTASWMGIMSGPVTTSATEAMYTGTSFAPMVRPRRARRTPSGCSSSRRSPRGGSKRRRLQARSSSWFLPWPHCHRMVTCAICAAGSPNGLVSVGEV